MVAFDHMRFKLSYLEWAYKYLGIYGKYFNNDDQMEDGVENVTKK